MTITHGNYTRAVARLDVNGGDTLSIVNANMGVWPKGGIAQHFIPVLVNRQMHKTGYSNDYLWCAH